MTTAVQHVNFTTPLTMDDLADAVGAPSGLFNLDYLYRGGFYVPNTVTGYNYIHVATTWVDYGSNTTMFEQYSTTIARCYWGGTTRYNGPIRSSGWYPFDPTDTTHPDWGLVSLYRKGPSYFGDYQGYTFWNIKRYDPDSYQELVNQSLPASGQISFSDFLAYGITVGQGVPIVSWELATAAYSGFSYDLSSLLGGSGSNFPTSIALSGDGSRFYFLVYRDSTSTNITEITLTTPWDIATGNWNGSFELYYGDPDVGFNGLTFKPDGTKMYVAAAGIGVKEIREYNLSSPNNLQTASYLRKSSISVSPHDIVISDDGTIVTIIENSSNRIAQQYQLSTPWDITTQTELTSRTYDFVGVDGFYISALTISSDGTQYLAYDRIYNKVYEYIMTTPHDISTSVYQNVSYTPTESTTLSELDFTVRPNGRDFYIMRGSGTQAITDQYKIV